LTDFILGSQGLMESSFSRAAPSMASRETSRYSPGAALELPPEKDLEDARLLSAREGLRRVAEGELVRDHCVEEEPAGLEEFQRRFEAPAAGADEGDFVDNHGGGVERDGTVDG
jgi:hypothetical protein